MLYKKSFIKKWLIRCIHLPPFMLHVWYPIIFSWHLSFSVLHTCPFISYCLLSCFCLIILSSVFLSPHVSFCSCSAAPHRYLSPPASLLLFHSTCLSSVLSSFATIHAFSWPVPVFFFSFTFYDSVQCYTPVHLSPLASFLAPALGVQDEVALPLQVPGIRGFTS